MKKFLKKIIYSLLNLIKIKPGSILILETSYPSGSNTWKIYKELKKIYDVDLITNDELSIKEKSIKGYIRYIKTLIKISGYNYLICSHGFYKYNSKQELIELWHGIPLKAMMYMERNTNIYRKEGFNADILITSSKLESSLLSACTHITFDRHEILGSPRNDYLFENKTKLDIVKDIKRFDKILIYMPTFREGYQNRVEGILNNNMVKFDDFDEISFINFLEVNNILLIIKYHPYEEELKVQNRRKYKNVIYLTNEVLAENELDLYELLPHTDLLITDYSSIYFDYLLLNKPVIFTPVDLEEYKANRGLLLEPYNFWTPGPKCKNQDELKSCILENLSKPNTYQNEREKIKDIFHRFQDGKSTERVIKLIEKIMREKNEKDNNLWDF